MLRCVMYAMQCNATQCNAMQDGCMDGWMDVYVCNPVPLIINTGPPPPIKKTSVAFFLIGGP